MVEGELFRDGSWEVSPSNLAWVEELYLSYRQDPASVDETWRRTFEALDRGQPVPMPTPGASEAAPTNGHAVAAPTNGHATAAPTNGHEASRAVELAVTVSAEQRALATAAADRALGGKRVRKLIEDYRELGHLAADLDPLGLVDRSKNKIRLEAYGLSDEDLDTLVSAEDLGGGAPMRLRDVIAWLEETYCGHLAVEVGHIHDADIRGWMQQRMESTRGRTPLSRVDKLHLLERVTEAEIFEQFLQTKFIGYKRFSLEGAESLVPVVDRIIERSAREGVSQIVVGMAHRGRLNVLTHVLGKPPSEIFAEFLDRTTNLSGEPGGDVKYHLGYSNDRVSGGSRVHISLAFNPSHLEWVDTVVQGRTRAKQDRIGDKDRTRGLAILIHGDAAFIGQGVVAEAFNMSGLPAYTVGGTIHIVVNNQIGFTTGPRSAYCTTYPTDMAKMLQVPIFHINGEDPEAVVQAVDIAVEFRQRFKRDVIIDMWCYRKLGHNEADEPSYTQPLMYKRIATHPSARQGYLESFSRTANGEAPVTPADAEAIAAKKRQVLDEALETAKKLNTPPPKPSTFGGVWSRVNPGPESGARDIETAVSPEVLQKVGQVIGTVPDGFTPHPKLIKQMRERLAMIAGQEPVNWGMGEALAFGTLLAEGVRVRFSGQDVRRGTFSHRHSTLVDFNTGAEYTPLEHVAPGQGTFEIRDSCLSEAGVLGFEYGYSLDMPEGLVLWEAQFGDFVNGAQVIIDQFLVSSEAKWRRVSGLVMLLPHGMEGQGPEHSSGRLERFLNMCVNDNIQVANVTTPAQIFHLLRRQVLRPYRKPLIVMSPKNLLRTALSPLSDFTSGRFQHVIPDTTVDPKNVNRVLLCSGKVYYDLVEAREKNKLDNVAIIRVEQLYPLRRDEILEALSAYREGIRVIWVQEEARNMGAWNYMNRELPPLLLSSFHWSGISRPLSASPATGSATRHKLEHTKLLDEAVGLVGKPALAAVPSAAAVGVKR